MKSKSLQCKSVAQLQQALQASISTDFQPTLAIVFSSLKYNFKELNEVFVSSGIDMLGCSTAGEIVDNELCEDSIAVLLMDMKKEYYTIKNTDFELSEVYSKCLEVGVFAKNLFENPGLVIMSGGIKVDAAKVIGGIKDGIGKEIPMYGGLAGDELAMSRTFAFSNHFITDGGMAALIIDTDKIEISGMAASGWKALGGVKTITRSEGNVLYSINGEPALDVFLRHFGAEDNQETKSDLLITLQTNYPLQILRADGGTILRSPLVLDEENRSLVLAGGVEQGDKFKFSNSPGFEVIEETVTEFESLKTLAPEADALVLFSCKGRHGAFGPVLEEEVEGLFNYWQKPMVGFLSYGEIGNTKNGICEFHNETCSLMLLREK